MKASLQADSFIPNYTSSYLTSRKRGKLTASLLLHLGHDVHITHMQKIFDMWLNKVRDEEGVWTLAMMGSDIHISWDLCLSQIKYLENERIHVPDSLAAGVQTSEVLPAATRVRDLIWSWVKWQEVQGTSTDLLLSLRGWTDSSSESPNLMVHSKVPGRNSLKPRLVLFL